jgi:hypothetical protein
LTIRLTRHTPALGSSGGRHIIPEGSRGQYCFYQGISFFILQICSRVTPDKLSILHHRLQIQGQEDNKQAGVGVQTRALHIRRSPWGRLVGFGGAGRGEMSGSPCQNTEEEVQSSARRTPLWTNTMSLAQTILESSFCFTGKG